MKSKYIRKGLRSIYGSWYCYKLKIKECNSTRITNIFGKGRQDVLPEFYADYGGINVFWKFWDIDQNNPTTKFVSFWANISV